MRDQRGIVEVSREYKCGDLHSDVALEIGENIYEKRYAKTVKGRQVSDLPVDLSRFRQIRWFYRAIRGKCGAGTHADDRNDGRDGAGHAITDRLLVVSVLPASIRGILRRGASGFYTTLGTVLVNPE